MRRWLARFRVWARGPVKPGSFPILSVRERGKATETLRVKKHRRWWG